MSRFTQIDLAKLPPPKMIKELDYEALVADNKAWLIEALPEIAPTLDLESEPVTKLIEAFSYRIMMVLARINDAGRAVMLASATGSDLDHLAALFGVERHVIQQADPSQSPPAAEIKEDDDALRRRTQLAPEGFSNAGSAGAYLFHTISVAGVKSAGVSTPAPGEVDVAILGYDGNGAADEALVSAVAAHLNDDDVRPLTDHVTVQSAEVVEFEITASLTLYHGPDQGLVLGEALAALQTYLDDNHRVGHDIKLSGIYAALHRIGAVHGVTLTSPAADIICDHSQAAFCTNLDVTVGGRDV